MLPPFVIVDPEQGPVGPIRDGAAVVFYNFRGDRAIEISHAFEAEAFEHFPRLWERFHSLGVTRPDWFPTKE